MQDGGLPWLVAPKPLLARGFAHLKRRYRLRRDCWRRIGGDWGRRRRSEVAPAKFVGSIETREGFVSRATAALHQELETPGLSGIE